MDGLCDIITLAGKFKSQSDLQKYCNDQFIALDKAAKQIKNLIEEVEHLKSLLTSTTPLLENEVHKIIITPEEALCDSQIQLLNKRAMENKELTLEEIKKFDLLVKNKRLIKDQATTIDGSTKPKIKDISQLKLIELASIKDEKNE